MTVSAGQTATRQLTVIPANVRAYPELTGDSNPLHFDAAFASRTRFGRLIAQGGIAVGLLHALVAMDLPGPGSVFLNQRWSFPNPVYIGDTIRAEATLTAWTSAGASARWASWCGTRKASRYCAARRR